MVWQPWASGRCKRNHDVTDPANVITRKDGVRCCRACKNLSDAKAVRKKALDMAHYPPRRCTWCHRVYRITDEPDPWRARRYWVRRKYCGEHCRLLAASDRGKVVKNRLSTEELERLRRAVGISV